MSEGTTPLKPHTVSWTAGLVVLAFSILMQMCLGATYSWSLFVGPLKQELSIGQGAAQAPFTLFYIVFPITAIFAGRCIRRLGMARCAALGGMLLGGGWIVAGFGGTSIAIVAAGIGVMGGIGVGLAYLVPIATCVQWFPKQKGLVTGIAVAGFGAGSALVAWAAGEMLDRPGATPFQAFRVLGAAFLLIVTTAATRMRLPAGMPPSDADDWTPGRAFRVQGFVVLYLAMFTGLMAGFTINANLKQLSSLEPSSGGAMAIALFALANAAGRIVWGAVADRAPMRLVIPANLAAQALALLMAPRLLRTGPGLNIVALAAGFNYGGVLVLYASAVARRWGAASVAGLYGLLFSANVPASLAPVAAGMWFDRSGDFTLPLIAIAAAMVTGSIFTAKHIHI